MLSASPALPFQLRSFPPFRPKTRSTSFHFSPPLPLRRLGFHRKSSGCSRFPPNSLHPSSSEPCSSGDDDDDEKGDHDFDDELGRLLALLPEEMRRRIGEHPERNQLIEVVMDLGRKPLARFPSGDFVLSESPIPHEDLEHATSQVGDFAVDNRAGISRTLHRISAIRNRKGTIIGLTCRVGRAISGSATLLRDLVQSGASLLLIGPPGVGKTTIIREIARMLANDYKKRVMIVDTSNEIGGDGDIPHEGIGSARRMQVPDSEMQHKVLIEAVENHMPQVIVIDEIGTKLEAMAASTIAQRGIQLVATAHGVTIENLIMNPALEMLVGGIQSVTLGDEEASRRRVQKTVLERKGPSTFNCGVEIVSKTELRVHRSLEVTVDAVLSGRLPYFEVRKIGIKDEQVNADVYSMDSSRIKNEDSSFIGYPDWPSKTTGYDESSYELPAIKESSCEDRASLKLYVYGILEASVVQGMKQLNLDEDAIKLTDNISEADALLAVQSKLKKNPGIQAAAQSHGISCYITKTSSVVQLIKALRALLRDRERSQNNEPEDKSKMSEKIDALEEARMAIERVVIPKREPVDLLPRSSYIMSAQMDFISQYQLQSEWVGKEPDVHLRILPYDFGAYEDGDDIDRDEDGVLEDAGRINENSNGSIYNVTRLPLLPD